MPNQAEAAIKITKSGSQYVDPADIVKSAAGREQIRQMSESHGSGRAANLRDSSTTATTDANANTATGAAGAGK